ncbi:DNA polymerase IV [Pseudalkalibacillus caeni]|uniref:DNA polymerase IV n=1 Tax=Exobacillus caeni TaxID=2574798 RepID=A0A5R9F1Y3_9BACL|nr:DNA polymerase IV [Pseudalkalibacillus caeni]TLS36406.1 DNA polymerase IV [Pseudalkalibacillus caeni]
MKNIQKHRIVFHVDMNSFYASVEVAHNPELKGKPLAIAGNEEERKGIVVTSSYEARKKGVKTTMPVWQAKKLCPGLIVMRPDFDRYRKASLQLFELLNEYTPLVEPVSIDEGYMDVTDYKGPKGYVGLAHEIQARLKDQFGLPSSIGIAPNKFLAKMASDMKKPMGITVLRKREIKEKLWPLKVGEMHGIGSKTEQKMNKLGIYTIGDLATSDRKQLELGLGVNGIRLFDRANGNDNRPVDPEAINEFKSVGNSTTFPEDLTDSEEIKTALTNLADSVMRRMGRKEVLASNIQLTIRYSDRKTVTRSRKLSNPIDHGKDIFNAAYYLFQKHWTGEPVRLLGITGFELVEKQEALIQLDLFSFEKEEKNDRLHSVVNQLRDRFGESALLRGNQARESRSNRLRDKKHRGTSLEKDFLRNKDKGS